MRLTILAVCAALAIPAAAAATSAPPATSSAAHLRHGLTPQERALYMKQLRGPDWRKLSIAQRCERAKTLRQQRRNMTPAQMQRLKQQLDAQWAKLPAAEKQRIEQRIARHEARKAEGKPRTHAHRCDGTDPAD